MARYDFFVSRVVPDPPEAQEKVNGALRESVRLTAVALGDFPLTQAEFEGALAEVSPAEREGVRELYEETRFLRKEVRGAFRQSTEDVLYARETRRWLEKLHIGGAHYAYTQAGKDLRLMEEVSIRLLVRILREAALVQEMEALEDLDRAHGETSELLSLLRKVRVTGKEQ